MVALVQELHINHLPLFGKRHNLVTHEPRGASNVTGHHRQVPGQQDGSHRLTQGGPLFTLQHKQHSSPEESHAGRLDAAPQIMFGVFGHDLLNEFRARAQNHPLLQCVAISILAVGRVVAQANVPGDLLGHHHQSRGEIRLPCGIYEHAFIADLAQGTSIGRRQRACPRGGVGRHWRRRHLCAHSIGAAGVRARHDKRSLQT
mmetsp:Transcript_71644/g.191146  ORF Transcript_71644/g.191146 Transcript_71644/m.191146 type:complete len:202 (+) Transcript_71644:1997-2602(+)